MKRTTLIGVIGLATLSACSDGHEQYGSMQAALESRDPETTAVDPTGEEPATQDPTGEPATQDPDDDPTGTEGEPEAPRDPFGEPILGEEAPDNPEPPRLDPPRVPGGAEAFEADEPLFAKFIGGDIRGGGKTVPLSAGGLIKKYQAPKGGNPDQISAGNGKLKEVDIVHLGGNDSGTPPLIVTAGGTGSVGVLSSFRSLNVGAAPTHLNNSPKLVGHDHQLLVLAPGGDKNNYHLLVSGRIRQQQLWLSTWRVATDGSFEHLHTLGYGDSVGVDVAKYGMTYRTLGSDNSQRFQLVTPIVHSGDRLRVVTWEVNAQSGHITGKYQTPNTSEQAASDTEVSAVFNLGDGRTDPHVVVAMRNRSAQLNHSTWTVDSAGVPSFQNSSNSGRTIRSGNPVTTRADNFAIAGVNHSGHVAASVRNGSLSLGVWEDADCVDGVCTFVPLSVANDTFDSDPNTPGVQQPPQFTPQPQTANVFLRDPVADEDLFVSNPDTVQAIASIRKVMVTIVTLDAVRDGEVSLDDIVTVSEAAANVNGNASAMNLQPGEQISLRNLLYGNMMVSAGDATWAISEYVAGSINNMLTRMNNKAFALGLTNTFHCQRGTVFSSVSYSTARDQTALWETMHDDPLFIEFAGEELRDVCGEVNGQPFCHGSGQNPPPMTNNSMFNYPNMDGYKTGGGGGKCQDIPQYATTPTCPSGGCLAMQTTRVMTVHDAVHVPPSPRRLA